MKPLVVLDSRAHLMLLCVGEAYLDQLLAWCREQFPAGADLGLSGAAHVEICQLLERSGFRFGGRQFAADQTDLAAGLESLSGQLAGSGYQLIGITDMTGFRSWAGVCARFHPPLDQMGSLFPAAFVEDSEISLGGRGPVVLLTEFPPAYWQELFPGLADANRVFQFNPR